MNVRKMKTVVAGVVLLIAVSLFITAGVYAQKPKEEKLSFSIATASTGGNWYPLGGAMSGIINNYVPNTVATSEATVGANDNLKLLTAGKVAMGFAYDYHAIWGNEGRLPAGIKGKHNLRLLFGFANQPLHFVTKEGTGITSLMQMKGKRVSTSSPNSGTEEQTSYVLKALGIDWNKDFRRERLGPSESVAAMKDGKIDAFFWNGAVPTAAIVDLASTPGIKMVLLPLGEELTQKIMKMTPNVFHKTVFAKGCYPGVEKDIDGIAITGSLFTMDTFPEERAYKIVKAIFDHTIELSPVWKDAVKMTPETSIGQTLPAALKYLHPGAQKFFKEKGVLK